MRGVTQDISHGSKVCPYCTQLKPLTDFYLFKTGKYAGKYSSYCSPCDREKQRNRVPKPKAREGHKFCTVCKEERSLSEFSVDHYRGGKPRPACKQCEAKKDKLFREANADYKRRTAKEYYWRNHKAVRARMNSYGRVRKARLKRPPAWASRDAIQLVYEKATEWSKILGIEIHVDHVVPLVSDVVCGLHVESNLQLLAKPDNISKGNRSWPDMPERDDELDELIRTFHAETN